MIKNDQQRQRAMTYLGELREAQNDPRFTGEQISPILSQIARLKSDIDRFDQARSGDEATFTIKDIGDLADVLVLARIARGYTQKALADEIGVTQQQVANDENGGYHTASLQRLSDVLDVLEYDLEASISPADRTSVAKIWFNADEDSETTAGRGPQSTGTIFWLGTAGPRDAADSDTTWSSKRILTGSWQPESMDA